MKKTIIIFGNCQAQMIARCLDSIPFFHDKYEVIWEQNKDIPSAPPHKELLQSQIKNCAYLLEQLGRKTIEFAYKDLLPSDCVIVQFPYLKLLCLWPLLDGNDPRNKPEPPKYYSGRFPYGDKIVTDKIKKKYPPDEIFDEYMRVNIKDYVDLDQLYQQDMQRIREVDDKCDIKVYNLISDNFKNKKNFSSFCHPTDKTFKLVLFEILVKTGFLNTGLNDKHTIKDKATDFSKIIVDGIEKFFNQTIFDGVQAPIHPQICEHFGLTWADSKTRYQYYDYGQLTFWEYMKLYIDYVEPDTSTAEKINNLLEAENFKDANIVLEQAIEKNPDSPDLLNLLGVLMLRTGKLDEAAKMFLDIIKRWPNHTEASNNLSVSIKRYWDEESI
jgi:tetratricopeptide (TPR) repeat protein